MSQMCNLLSLMITQTHRRVHSALLPNSYGVLQMEEFLTDTIERLKENLEVSLHPLLPVVTVCSPKRVTQQGARSCGMKAWGSRRPRLGVGRAQYRGLGLAPHQMGCKADLMRAIQSQCSHLYVRDRLCVAVCFWSLFLHVPSHLQLQVLSPRSGGTYTFCGIEMVVTRSLPPHPKAPARASGAAVTLAAVAVSWC